MYTTIEQAKELVEVGLNPETSDMHYNEYIIDVSDLTGNYYIGFASSNREMYIYDLVLYN